MYKQIKYTLVPDALLDDALYESATILTDRFLILSPLVLFNDTLELGLDAIYEDVIDEEDIKYIDEKELISEIQAYIEEDYGNCIILNGFDISLDFVKEKLIKLSRDNNIIFSINNITDERKYTSFSMYVNTENEITDEEWKEYVDKFEKEKNKSKDNDTIDNKIKIVNLNEMTDEEYEEYIAKELFPFDLFKFNEDNKKDKDKEEEKNTFKDAIVKPKNNSGYKSYAFEDEDSMIVIDHNKGKITIATDEGMVKIPEKHIDFIIDILNKFKYND